MTRWNIYFLLQKLLRILNEHSVTYKTSLLTHVYNPSYLCKYLYVNIVNVGSKNTCNFSFIGRAHKVTRCKVERCFGQLKRRWNCLHWWVHIQPAMLLQHVQFCIILQKISTCQTSQEASIIKLANCTVIPIDREEL